MPLRFKGKRRVEPEEIQEETKEEVEEEIKEEPVETEEEPDDMSEVLETINGLRDRLEEMYGRMQDIQESLQSLAIDGIYINDEVAKKVEDDIEDKEDISLEDLDFSL